MEKPGKGLFTVLQVVLWLSFITAINDPGILTDGNRPPGNMYGTFAFVFQPLYTVSGYISAPTQWIFQELGLYRPESAGWFPYSSAQEWHDLMTIWGVGGVFSPTLFQGALIWWVPLSSMGLFIVSTLFYHYYEVTRNWAWNLIVEYGFHQKKTQLYAQELQRAKADLDRKSKEVKVLVQETHSLKDSVITDELTQVFNKRFFLDRLQQEFAVCRTEKTMFSLIMIDIDYFKKLNDTYGHVTGDNVLAAVAQTLKRFSPDQTFPCRYGGEEFSIIMPRKTVDEAVESARLIQEYVQRLRFDHIDPKLRVTVSQGVCTVDFASSESYEVRSCDAVLQFADQELYRSKTQGRNRVSVHTVGINQPGQANP